MVLYLEGWKGEVRAEKVGREERRSMVREMRVGEVREGERVREEIDWATSPREAVRSHSGSEEKEVEVVKRAL